MVTLVILLAAYVVSQPTLQSDGDDLRIDAGGDVTLAANGDEVTVKELIEGKRLLFTRHNRSI